MRYFNFVLKTTSEKIESETKKIRLRDFDYDSAIGAMNNYIAKNIKNNISFFAYREEEDAIQASFSYDEQKVTFSDACDHITNILKDIFSIKHLKSEPCEITTAQFFDNLMEARRRAYFTNWGKVMDMAHLEYHDALYRNDQNFFRYDLKEKIISDKIKKDDSIYDESVLKELANIEAHKNTSELKCNMVHYFISSKSTGAASDITEALTQRLAAANRLSGRRMEIISDIDPQMYNGHNYLENIIENNFGGVMVFDLSEKFGCSTTEYGMVCKYLEKLVTRYKNDCLFVFTYNPDRPGFAYELLRSVSKHVIPVRLKEGTGDRKAAVKYLKGLIKSSDYAKYADQANEFMKTFPGNEFSQTDVLNAYEQFEPWCLNKNVLHAYDYSFDTFMLDRDENHGSSYEKLNKLIGLTSVKDQVDRIVAADIVEKERKKRLGNDYETGTMHMVFRGNPGSAKTTVAKLFAGIAKEKGILKSGAFVERGGMDLDGPGCVFTIRDAFKKAEGGVLFIDEAYSLKSDTAVTVLIQEMENRRDSVIVILAGYEERMQEFMERNEGLKSRVPYHIDFPDYDTDELTDIFRLMVKERGFEASDDAVNKARDIFERARYMDNFGNGRFVRNLLEHAIQNQSIRILADNESAEKIRSNKLFLITGDDISLHGEDIKLDRERGTARKELDAMIGLSQVKAILNKIVANFKLKKLLMDKGICKDNPSLHMVFSGNPGTAKTTVARLFAEIMKDEKLLPSGNFVEVGRADIISDHVGGTAPLVKKKFRDAQGGVLFIDEAYSLCDDRENSFGDEAINTIVQEMENHRDDVIVIFAGYSDKMKSFLDRNPGMASRIAFHVEFEDYSTDELCDITRLMLSKKQMTVTGAAMEKLRDIYEKARKDSSFGNGRFARKMLEEAEMNLAERISHSDESELTTALITTVEEIDIPELHEAKKQREKLRIGFC